MIRDALVIGVNFYHSSQLNDLTVPSKDAEAISQLLEKFGNFNVRRLPEAIYDSTPRVGKTLELNTSLLRREIAQLLNPDSRQVPDTALVYFSGHGLRDPYDETEGYLATSDAEPDRDMFGLSLQWLRRQLEQSPIREQIIWLDCCHSGAFLNFDAINPGDKGNARARCFMTASREFEAAYVDLETPYSTFTKVLLEGLDPKRSATGQVTNDDLRTHINQTMTGVTQRSLCSNSGTPVVLTFLTAPKLTKAMPVKHRQPSVPLQMPPLPKHFIERPKHQQRVQQYLLSDGEQTPGTLVVSAIYGLGGIGKSVLAAALAHDVIVQKRFPDGILWVTLGQSPDILPLLSSWIQALGDYDYKPLTIEAASAHLRTLLYSKRTLLVVDDVWKPGHLEPFRVGGSGSCVLVTTREAKIPDAQRYDLDVMTQEQSLSLFEKQLSEPLTKEAQRQAIFFSNRVGFLPLAIELAAAQIEDGVTWAELLEDFQEEIVRLEALDFLSKDDMPEDAKRRKYSLIASFNLSLRQLTPEQLRQFAWLGVLPEDINISQEMAATLWQVTPRQAGSILRTFRAKALLLSGAKQQRELTTYRMHDLMHDLAQRLLVSPPQPTQSNSLAGLGLTQAEAHATLLEHYSAKTQAGQWHTLSDDGYIYNYLTWHMEKAKCPEAIHKLLQEENVGRNGWYEACDAVGKSASFVNDIGRAWSLAKDKFEQNPVEAISLLLRYTLIRSSLNSLADNIPPKLLGALVEKGVWQPAQGLAYAQQTQNPLRRSEFIIELAPHIPEVLLPEVLETVYKIHEDGYCIAVLSKLTKLMPELWPEIISKLGQMQENQEFRLFLLLFRLAKLTQDVPEAVMQELRIKLFSDKASALIRLVEHLPESLLPKALEITSQLQDESNQAFVLEEIVEHLPESLLPKALEIARQIQGSSDQVNALKRLAEYLPALWPEILEITHQIQDESTRARVLTKMIEHLPKSLLPKALEIAHQIQGSLDQVNVLKELAEHLPELWPEVLEATHQIQDESTRARVLANMIEHLPELLLPKALEIARQIQENSGQVNALIKLAEHLPELWPEVLEVAHQIQDKRDQAETLKESAKSLPELWPETLEVTHQIQDESSKAEVLKGIIEHLPETYLHRILDIAYQIQNESDRTRVFQDLAKYLPESFAPRVLDIVRQLQSGRNRSLVLSEIVEYLPKSVLPEVLEVTCQIQGRSDRTKFLKALAKHLPESLLPQALETTRQIQDESAWAQTLKELAESLPELWPKALSSARQIQNRPDRADALQELAKCSSDIWPDALLAIHQIQNECNRSGGRNRKMISTLVSLW